MLVKNISISQFKEKLKAKEIALSKVKRTQNTENQIEMSFSDMATNSFYKNGF